MWVTSFGNGMKKGSLLTTGVDASSKAEFGIYPNPATTTISLSVEKDMDAKIYSASGTLVRNLNLKKGENVIDIENMSPGFYFISAGSHYSKFIVTK
jgi:hypothetical protein